MLYPVVKAQGRRPEAKRAAIGLVAKRTVMVGEAKWTEGLVGARELGNLVRGAAAAPDPLPNPLLVFWSRGSPGLGIAPTSVRTYTPDDMATE